MTRLFFLRHGESMDNVARVYASRPPGLGLSPAGRSQAAAAAEGLAGRGIGAVYASTARRAVETAQVLGGALDVPVHRSAGLLEYDMGALEGQPIPAQDDDCLAVLRSWVVDGRLDVRLPGGESGDEVRRRFEAAVAGIAAAHEGGAAAVVCHVGTLTVGLLGLCAGLTADDVWGHPLPHALPLTLTDDGSGWHCSPWPRRSPADRSAGSGRGRG